MTANRWRQITDIFHAALTREAAERAAFIAARCGGDAALQREVASLLAAHSHTGRVDRAANEAGAIIAGVLAEGQRLGPYEVIEFLGAGGAGVVCRAHDTRLRRDVAIKVLWPGVNSHSGWLERFSREAQVLASLNHPNIAQIHGLEESASDQEGRTSVRALVMELVEGPTLADRLADGALSLADALPIARQIAEALEAAHERHVVHRDLKPANIKVRADGTVKVLDFGLAKALDVEHNAANGLVAGSGLTETGTILGTAAYMSPEQARGKPAGPHADIWAFGCVLFEMLAGVHPFRGDSLADTVSAVLSKEPDWTALPATAWPVQPLIARCLRKEMRQRLQAIGDARIQIEELSGSSPSADSALTPAVTGLSARRWPLSAFVAVAVAAAASVGALAAWMATRPTPPAEEPAVVSRFEIVPPPALALAVSEPDRNLVISPDGRHIAYRAGAETDLLVVRGLDTPAARPLNGIRGVRQPFFSPDGQWIGFFEGANLRKTPVAGGSVTTIHRIAGVPRGASWADDNTIVYATSDTGTGLLRVPASGGEPVVLTRPDTSKGEVNHRYPFVLPGDRGVLFTITTSPLGNVQDPHVAALDARTREIKTLVRGSQAEYLETGHLVYAAAGGLHAVRFDLARLEVSGDPVLVLDSVGVSNSGAMNYSVARSGTLVYVPSTPPASRSLVWVDRQGREEPIPAPRRAYVEPRLSPDGTQVALSIRDQENDIWILDFRQGPALRRLTFGPSNDTQPVWTPDGRRIVFSSNRDAVNLFTKLADGSGTEERVTVSPYAHAPAFVSSDGSRILGTELLPASGSDIVWFALKPRVSDGESGSVLGAVPSPVAPIIRTPAIENQPSLSPDGRYFAYESNETGPFEIYVRPFPRVNDGKWQVSAHGGTRPRWSGTGREIFYLDLRNRLTSVPVHTSDATFNAGAPTRLFDDAYAQPIDLIRPYDVAADGTRFLMIKEDPEAAANRGGFTVVVNWFEELRRRVP